MLGSSSNDSIGLVIAAGIASIPATLAWLSSRNTQRKLQTSNGTEVGEYVENIRGEQVNIALAMLHESQRRDQAHEELATQMKDMHQIVTDHLESDEQNFAQGREALENGQAALVGELQSIKSAITSKETT